ncbi:glycosyltransferase family 2 protein [Sediminibacterium ginsengisoli]|uniref:Glycosyl transferase family 2 n=1 Tax=Sediminibacterium ginsengisoli TaxID=413434 RepID=A0A1T4RME6_9BACT|nr:glycosyltransferase family 2 protein [Sediminibacterium ginsengisoli]SKA17113.1 Glycosyl transferase family 2 [Sediminibacterium ginsengisoli]
MRPISIPANILRYWNTDARAPESCAAVQAAYRQNLYRGIPDVSIVIPAYNEEDSIVKTLTSLCNNQTRYAVEIIVVDNNSADRTAELVKACGVTCVPEPKQGITNARNGGLAHANGTYVLNADADTIYPQNWIDEMIRPLDENKNAALSYGIFSFIPIGKTGRLSYFFYEYFSDWTRFFNRRFREEAVNVYGFNSAFRREQGLSVDGFNHPPGTNEDGWLAVKLRDKGYGKLHLVTKAPVWTTDRRLQIDGGLGPAVRKRIKRFLRIKN